MTVKVQLVVDVLPCTGQHYNFVITKLSQLSVDAVCLAMGGGEEEEEEEEEEEKEEGKEKEEEEEE